jgi:putative restriction endonuclease
MSVEARGPDTEVNGIALSGTVHWMFDRGLTELRNFRNSLSPELQRKGRAPRLN